MLSEIGTGFLEIYDFKMSLLIHRALKMKKIGQYGLAIAELPQSV